MEFKMSEKSKNNWQNMMDEMGVESQMSEEALYEKKIKEYAEKIKKDAEHLEHLEKYHFSSAKEMIDYVYSGKEVTEEYNPIFTDKIKLMEDGRIGHLSLWLSDDDCVVEGVYWKTQAKESFEEWVNLISGEEHLDNGYLPVWHKTI
jgi:hypothetical protein